MYLFERILKRIRGKMPRRSSTNYTLSVEAIRSLEFIAERERRTPQEVANRVLGDVLHNQQSQDEIWRLWSSLTPREQEVAVLICRQYTTRQIAGKLHISPETVKTHVEHVLVKFGTPDRNIFRLVLSEWDFSNWEHPSKP
jgi:DNA-binding CsgD family transcriptional regulator